MWLRNFFVCLNYISSLSLYLRIIVFEFEYQKMMTFYFIVSSIYINGHTLKKKREKNNKEMLCLRSIVTTSVI